MMVVSPNGQSSGKAAPASFVGPVQNFPLGHEPQVPLPLSTVPAAQSAQAVQWLQPINSDQLLLLLLAVPRVEVYRPTRTGFMVGQR